MAINPHHEALWKALNALPRPVTFDAVTECAKTTLPGKEAGEFAKWFQVHEAYLLGRLNG